MKLQEVVDEEGRLESTHSLVGLLCGLAAHGASHNFKVLASLDLQLRGSGQGSCDRKSGDRAVSWAECSDPDRLDRSAAARDS